MGIFWAFIAMVCWGFGDFFIQKTTRVVGSLKALFFIGVVGMLGLFPFVKNDLVNLDATGFFLLGLVAVVAVVAAFIDFEALRQGKIAIVEPIIGLELPLTVGFSIALAKESLSAIQIFIIGLVFFGIMLAITAHHTHWHYHKRIFERGVILAGVGAMGMALTNFLVGVASQDISPLVTIWFIHSFLAVICGILLLLKGEIGGLVADLRNHAQPIISQSIFDNIAWVSFATATTAIPIAVATTISESYIAMAVVLGLLVNHERLKTHQFVGVALATIGVIALSYFSS